MHTIPNLTSPKKQDKHNNKQHQYKHDFHDNVFQSRFFCHLFDRQLNWFANVHCIVLLIWRRACAIGSKTSTHDNHQFNDHNNFN